jgi:hypothetical protein
VRRTDPSSSGDLPIVVCHVCDLETPRMRRLWPALGCCARRGGGFVLYCLYVAFYVIVRNSCCLFCMSFLKTM